MDTHISGENDPSLMYGDLPQGALFTVNLGSGKTGSHVKHERKQMHEQVPIWLAQMPSADDMRVRFNNLLSMPPNASRRPHPAMALLWEQGEMQKAMMAESGEAVYGPTHNPADKMRTETAWEKVPFGSFFMFDKKPHPDADVYLRSTDNQVRRICTFERWQQDANINDPGENISLSDVTAIQPSKLEVTVLKALTPEEFDRIIEQYPAQDLGRKDEQTTFNKNRREKIAQFWESLSA